jgi:threonine synthase
MKQCVDVLGFHPLSSYTAYPTGDPYSQEGDKTIAYEVCEDLGWKAPNKVLVPAGQGLILSGFWGGFVDLFELGLIESLPIMIGVESFAGRAFSGTRVGGPKLDQMRPEGATIARHACASRAALKGLKAIADSKGYSVAVAEDDILNGAISLAREDGVLPSTTSSTTIAALGQLVHSGLLETTDTIVCVITASGLKDVDLLERGVEPMPSIPPDLASLRRLAEARGIRLPSPV